MIDERPYDELAGELDTSEAALRQRVSRSLATLRRRKGTRAMSDYVTELRRTSSRRRNAQARRGRAGRAPRPLHPRAWSPTGAGRRAWRSPRCSSPSCVTLTTLAPPPKPSDAKIVATVQLGGQPRDAVLAGGSLWIADYEGRVVQLDPATRRVRARIPVGGTPVSVTADRRRGLGDEHRRARSAIALAPVPSSTPAAGSVLDARGGRRLSADAIAAGAGGLWLVADGDRGDLERIDLDTHRRTAFIPDARTPSDLAVNGRSVWTRRGRTA